MTAEQFAALAELLRLRAGSAAAEALRLVLCEGLTHAAAAEVASIPRQNVTRSVGQARRVIEAAQALAGVNAPHKRNY